MSSVLNATITERSLLLQIMIELRYRYASLNHHYEAAFTDSFCTRRCSHPHQTVVDAARCVTLNGAGWYVVSVECDTALELAEAETPLGLLTKCVLKESAAAPQVATVTTISE